MTDHLRLYVRPKPLACSLAIAGPLAPFRVGDAYTGYLAVSGQHGDVSILSWSGLPPGGAVAWDSANSRIVVTWPAYTNVPPQDLTSDAKNKNFELGDVDWDKGAGWTIMQGETAPDPGDPGSQWQAMFWNQNGNSFIMNQVAVQVQHGKTYTASVDVQQGGSSANHAGAAVRLEFVDLDGNLVYAQEGNYIKSGSDSHWKTSHLSAACPANAAYVKLGAVAYRSRENRKLWVDNLVWNGAFTYHADASLLGNNGEDPIDFTVTIRDERGCRATWTGRIYDYAVYLTSQIYGVFVDDGEEGAPLVTGGKVDNLRVDALQQSDEDSPLVSGGSVQALSLVKTIEYTTLPTQGPDDADSPLVTGGSVQALSVTKTVEYGTYDQPQDDADSPLITGGSVQALNLQVTTGYQTYNHAQDDSDSPLVTGGSVTNLSITVP